MRALFRLTAFDPSSIRPELVAGRPRGDPGRRQLQYALTGICSITPGERILLEHALELLPIPVPAPFPIPIKRIMGKSVIAQ